MNERIEKLFHQALEKFKAENEYATIVEPDPLQRDFVEKFAELIVRECMECSDWVGVVNKNPDEPIHTAHAINKRIKAHFGVEG